MNQWLKSTTSLIRKLTQKKKKWTMNPSSVRVSYGESETDQRRRNVGLSSTMRWTWKHKEERLSESEAMKVGESECLRGVATMRVGETMRVMA